jgi:hypothetical protein
MPKSHAGPAPRTPPADGSSKTSSRRRRGDADELNDLFPG